MFLNEFWNLAALIILELGTLNTKQPNPKPKTLNPKP